jgi:hypothetical protein
MANILMGKCPLCNKKKKFDGKNKTFKISVNLPAGCMMLSFNTMSP